MNEDNTTPPADRPTGADVPTASDRSSTVPQPRESAPPTSTDPQSADQKKADQRQRRKPGMTDSGKVRHGRASALYVGLIVAAILTIFLLIFIAQNSDKVAVQFLGFEGQISLAVALLLSAVIGVLVVAVPGSLRIVQLRRALRKNAKA